MGKPDKKPAESEKMHTPLRTMAALAALAGTVDRGSGSFLQSPPEVKKPTTPEVKKPTTDFTQFAVVPAGQEGWEGSHGMCVDDANSRVADRGTIQQLPAGQHDVSACMDECRADAECQAVHAFFWATPGNQTNLWNVGCRYVSSYYQDPVESGPAVRGFTAKNPANTDCNICFVNQHFEPTTTTAVAPSCPSAVPAGQQGWQGFDGRCIDEDDELVADCGTTEEVPPGQDVSHCMATCSADEECQAVHASFKASASDPNLWSVVCNYVSSSCKDPEATGPAVGGRSNDKVLAYTDCSVCFVKPTSYQH